MQQTFPALPDTADEARYMIQHPTHELNGLPGAGEGVCGSLVHRGGGVHGPDHPHLRRDIGEKTERYRRVAHSPGPKRPPGRVFGTSTRHPSHAVKSAAAFLSGGEISERFWRDIGEMGVTLGPRGGNSAEVRRPTSGG
jgi:hypothetical protein